jgi:hypothetical protein
MAGTGRIEEGRHPLVCPALPPFDPDGWPEIERAFARAPRLDFSQPWRAEPEPAFRPGRVRIGWRADRFCYLAELEDDALFTSATTRNQPLWELGDVLETFVGAKGSPGYIEYHAAPNGTILQLRWPSREAFLASGGADGLTRFADRDDAATSRVRATGTGWAVYGEIPSGSVPGASGGLAGQVWEVNFGRYDYREEGRPPVLSATSPLARLSFHRRDEWRLVEFR